MFLFLLCLNACVCVYELSLFFTRQLRNLNSFFVSCPLFTASFDSFAL